MFKEQKAYSLYSYNIDILEILDPFIDLTKDIISNSITHPNLLDIINFEQIDENYFQTLNRMREEIQALKEAPSPENEKDLETKQEKYLFELERATSLLTDYFDRELFDNSNLDLFTTSNLLYFIKSQKKFVSIPDRPTETLKQIISKYGIIKHFHDILISSELKQTTINFLKFDRPQFYQVPSWINSQKTDAIYCPVIDFDLIDIDLIDVEECELNDLWVNTKKMKSLFSIDITLRNQALIRSQETSEIIGFRLDSYFFSLYRTIKNIIKPDRLLDFYWLQIYRGVYNLHTKQSSPKPSETITRFITNVQEEEFITVLSFLKKNLYLSSSSTIDQKYLDFFDPVFRVENLDHINDFEFYLPDLCEEEKSVLGIYLDSKPKNGNFYNLIHWISNQNKEKYFHYHEAIPLEKSKDVVLALKPEISFYFRSKFFEDYVEAIIKELNLPYVSNIVVSFGENQCEIDFLVRVDNNIYLIETKTKLTCFYIDEFEKKCERYITELSAFEGNINFLLISAFSDENCQLYRHYVENNSIIPENNKKRQGLNTTIYGFNIPISSHKEKMLTCISEPVYSKLRTLISTVCK